MPGTDDNAKSRYQGDAGRQYHATKRAIPDAAFPWVARLRAEKLAPDIRPEDVVLEYGVGLGWNLAALSCARRIGLDVGEFLAETLAARGITFVLDPNSVADESVDVVVCHHMLEHALQPIDILAQISRMLRPKGRLLLFVPYEKEKRYRRFRPDEPNHHLYSWNVQTLGNLVQDAGFDLCSAGTAPFGQERFAAVLATRLKLGERGFRLIRWMANTIKHELEVRVVGVKGFGEPATKR